MTGMIALHGGWGHDNLGDEAILASYLQFLRDRDLLVASPDVEMTSRAQGLGVGVVREGDRIVEADVHLLAGGGYLNGSWRDEIPAKVRRILRGTQSAPLVVHAVEVRRWVTSSPASKLDIERLLSTDRVSVRDAESSVELQALGLPTPDIVPDSIALFYRRLESYIAPVPALAGRVVLNLLDIAARADKGESLIPVDDYDHLAAELVRRLGNRAIGLVVGAGDYKYMSRFPELDLVEPRTVEELVSLLAGASTVISVRMHPALIASMLGKPTFAIPYCGKVAPTLRNIGIEDQLLMTGDPEFVMDHLQSTSGSSTSAWESASRLTGSWLNDALRHYF